MNDLERAIYEYEKFVLPLLRRRMVQDRKNAATTIQAAARGMLARKELQRRKEDKAATVIQSAARGMIARNQANRLREEQKKEIAELKKQIGRGWKGVEKYLPGIMKGEWQSNQFIEAGWDPTLAKLGTAFEDAFKSADDDVQQWRHLASQLDELIGRLKEDAAVLKQIKECREQLPLFEGDQQRLTNLEKVISDIQREAKTEKRGGLAGLIRKFDDKIRQYEAPSVVATKSNPNLEQARLVYADMKAQYRRWDGVHTRRGGYWGAAGPGATAGARNVPRGVVHELKHLVQQSSTWKFQDSFTGGASFHRKKAGQEDFIYHMKPPPTK
jgi:hypothetical protein